MRLKTDKELVWEAIKEIEKITSDYHPTFAMLADTIWKNYPKEDRLRLRGILLTNKLITVLPNQQWAFQLTALGMMVKLTQLKNNGSLKKNYSPELIRGVIIAAIAALLGLGTATIQAKYLSDRQTKMLVLPKIQLVHDTVLVKR